MLSLLWSVGVVTVTLGKDRVVEFLQGYQLLLVDEVELIDVEEEMAIARVQMCFNAECADLFKVVTI